MKRQQKSQRKASRTFIADTHFSKSTEPTDITNFVTRKSRKGKTVVVMTGDSHEVAPARLRSERDVE